MGTKSSGQEGLPTHEEQWARQSAVKLTAVVEEVFRGRSLDVWIGIFTGELPVRAGELLLQAKTMSTS